MGLYRRRQPAQRVCAIAHRLGAFLDLRHSSGNPVWHHRATRRLALNEQEHKAVIFDTASGKWLKCTPDGGSMFVSDQAQASKVDASQLEAYIRGHELEYLRYSLVTQPAEG